VVTDTIVTADTAPIEIETGPHPTASIIWLHGLGADGHDFEPIIPELGLPESLVVRFVFPHVSAGDHKRWRDNASVV
jgi:predicted esterase